MTVKELSKQLKEVSDKNLEVKVSILMTDIKEGVEDRGDCVIIK